MKCKCSADLCDFVSGCKATTTTGKFYNKTEVLRKVNFVPEISYQLLKFFLIRIEFTQIDQPTIKIYTAILKR